MENILQAPFVTEMVDIMSNMYRLGWDERNGGNISYMLDGDAVGEYLDTGMVIRELPLKLDAASLAGKYFLVTGSNKYFKNVSKNIARDLGIIRISADGCRAELLWGFEDGGRFTSEMPAHLLGHMARLKVEPRNRVIMHSHPTHTLAMNYVVPLTDKAFTHALWQMCTECIGVFPEGVGVLPWMLPGTNDIGKATAEKFRDYRLVVWGMHGIYASGKTIDEAFGLIETVEKAAQVYMLTDHKPRLNVITDEQLMKLGDYYGDPYRKDFLDL